LFPAIEVCIVYECCKLAEFTICTYQYQEYVSEYLESECNERARNLYEPIHYILGTGKRIRPVLTLMTAEIFETDLKKALPAALAVEVFIIFVGTR
jgi:geranylgeranyl pyrophosphate synthase